MIRWERERMKYEDKHLSVWIETGKGLALENSVHTIAYLRHDPLEARRVWLDILRESSAFIAETTDFTLPRIVQYNAPHAYGLLSVVMGVALICRNPNAKGKKRGEMRHVIAHECEFDEVTVALTDLEAVRYAQAV